MGKKEKDIPSRGSVRWQIGKDGSDHKLRSVQRTGRGAGYSLRKGEMVSLLVGNAEHHNSCEGVQGSSILGAMTVTVEVDTVEHDVAWRARTRFSPTGLESAAGSRTARARKWNRAMVEEIVITQGRYWFSSRECN
jgi:hypothetical protein